MRRLHTRMSLGRSDRGFSFIELLAYMAIAALLVLAAIPQFNQYRQKAVVSNLQNDVHNASLKAEAELIGQVSKRTGDNGGIHLAAASGGLDIADLQAAVNTVKPSSTTDKPFIVSAVGVNGYSITAASTKTDITAVYESTMDTAHPTYGVGINTVDKDGAVMGVAPTATPSPSSSASTGFTPDNPAGTPAISYDPTVITGQEVTVSPAGVMINVRTSNNATTKLYPGSSSDGDNGHNMAANPELWIGSTKIALPTPSNDFATSGTQTKEYYAFSTYFYSYGDPILTDAQALSHETITMAYTDDSGYRVVYKAKWDASWNQTGGNTNVE
ncbi:hypothetical protein GCM10025867_48980 (plasmid) [Frondihabitans sucicola]|uniref:Prepilin-type N-terminal cleavage/methylation domain-containing protein n=1 Tax=Frondihabitans sucicola TaxID=1268041 RepID=A0ABM8GW58_9MICO|nr:prepilin-type N-terminal cleavage/methylation domain-containing protein [Frondihabitans sucicola]BDZ52657.1 hypothetical protein GCM10025867_48980 [Frondihabitans sucicola]